MSILESVKVVVNRTQQHHSRPMVVRRRQRLDSITMTKERMARVMAEKATDATSVGFIPPLCTHSHVLIPSPMDLPVHLVLVSLF